MNGEIELGKLGNPPVSGDIQLGCSQDIGQRAIVRVHSKGVARQVPLENFG